MEVVIELSVFSSDSESEVCFDSPLTLSDGVCDCEGMREERFESISETEKGMLHPRIVI